ncbi:hypothetical protein QN277_022632 [Acacia crassicarpa]|uniref:F-box domain-containing protein n=1 Tax=Acacia crassicarpa TaxID=499986 RepID=A0AAE1JH88_9FABA|nr:hypothetical protein QN277_022632 [Acacia crassicarpa]
MEHLVVMDGVTLFLPQEIITNILKFLPVKSLIKFQCVCKHWKNLIKTPFFIAMHLHHSTQLRPHLLLHRHYTSFGLQLYFLDYKRQIVKVSNLPVVDDKVLIVGSSHGLLCLQIGSIYSDFSSSPRSYLLWNPVFREVRHVPFTFPNFDRDGPRVFGFGFGFSPIVNDYKIVIVTLYQAMDHDLQNHPVVYSLRMGSWKQVKVGILRGLVLNNAVGFTMNGSIFWLGYKQDCAVMISFDIAMEEFALMPMPSTVGQDHARRVNITEFERRLALLFSPSIGYYKSKSIELWVLENGTGGSGERWSWAKKYTSSPYLGFLIPITIWKNEIVGIYYPGPHDKSHSGGTVMSNFTNTELNVLSNETHLIYSYVESLVPVS